MFSHDSSNFSKDLVKVEATVIEKTLSHIRVHYEKVKKFQRFKCKLHKEVIVVKFCDQKKGYNIGWF